MDLDTELERILQSYQRYYDINRESPMAPFDAEAVFRLHDEEYFLIRSAKVAEQDSFEYVFFLRVPELDGERAKELTDLVWQECLRRAEPKKNHRNTDTQLVILCERMTEEAARVIRKANPYKSYRFGLWGWSTMKVIAYEISGGRSSCNRRGENLKKLIGNK